MGKIVASVLLQLLINGNERCHTIDAPQHMSETVYSYQNNINDNQ